MRRRGGKNTGVGCHFLLQCMKVKSESEVAQSCPTQRPHGPQPTRLPHPWDFPGKSTGVGRHCLLHTGRWQAGRRRSGRSTTTRRVGERDPHPPAPPSGPSRAGGLPIPAPARRTGEARRGLGGVGQPVPRLGSALSSRRHLRCLGNRRGAALSPPLPPPSAPLASEGSSPPPSASAEPGGLECGVPGGSGPRARLSRLVGSPAGARRLGMGHWCWKTRQWPS